MGGKMWEVDPQTAQKLQEIQKKNGNKICVDCDAPGPQWASPKFGIFMCLSCSGIHRGLGVHISFVRSISMDAFKSAEITRMDLGGNKPWQEFWENHEITQLEGRTWDDCTIRERYEGEVGEEWKARLTAKLEEREYVPGEEKQNQLAKKLEHVGPVGGNPISGSRSGTPISMRAATPISGAIAAAAVARSSSPGIGTMSMSKKAQNEVFFAKMGAENGARPDHLPPSAGGKYTGFGSDPWPPPQRSKSGMPGADDFHRDPLAALTKGFGWFGGMVQKGVGDVTQRIAAADLQSQARVLGTTVSASLQNGSKAATNTFTRFVEGEGGQRQQRQQLSQESPERKEFWDDFAAAGQERMADHGPRKPDADKLAFWDDFAAAGDARVTVSKKPIEPDRKDFWDEFSSIGEAKKQASTAGVAGSIGSAGAKVKASIGTAAMKRPTGAATDKKDDEWNEW